MSFLTDGEKNECYGCGACVSACPHNCIHMQEDEEGFRYPNVDRDRCRNCGLCEKVCPKGFAHYLDASGIRAYYGINKNRKTVEGSSSGGAFTTPPKRFVLLNVCGV